MDGEQVVNQKPGDDIALERGKELKPVLEGKAKVNKGPDPLRWGVAVNREQEI